jgi:RND family efflux transporter MFP subunit
VPPAEAALENARRVYERRQELYAKGGISKKDLESSQLDVANAAGALKSANSKVAEAQNHLGSLDAQLSYAEIRAPFDGVITDQFAYQGDFATAGNKLLTIADASVVIVKAPISDDAATRVHAGDAATIMPDDLPGVTLQAAVTLVGRSADPQSRAVEVWITLPNPDGRLRPNAPAHVTIASNAATNAVIVPTPAVTLDATNANGGTVMVVDAQSVAHEVQVTIGAHDRQRTQITSGLHGGETVVVEGNYGLPDQTKVTVAQ